VPARHAGHGSCVSRGRNEACERLGGGGLSSTGGGVIDARLPPVVIRRPVLQIHAGATLNLQQSLTEVGLEAPGCKISVNEPRGGATPPPPGQWGDPGSLRARAGSAPRVVEGAGAAEGSDLQAGSAVSMRHKLKPLACPIGRFWPSARRPRVCQQKHNVGKTAQLGLVGLCSSMTSICKACVSFVERPCWQTREHGSACRAVSKSQREAGLAAKHQDKWHDFTQPPCANGKHAVCAVKQRTDSGPAHPEHREGER